ncbi:MAG: hypothetical protein AB7S72_18960 [Draconibacterium sp.]
MNEQWQKLSKKELIELYESKAKLLSNEASEIPLLSLCAAFTLVGSSFPNLNDKLNLRFINSLANSIYHHHENSFLIQTAIKGRTEVNKTTVINTLGMLGIKEMDKNITQVLQLQDCFIILFLIYLKDNNCDLEELLSFLGLIIRHNNQTESQNLSVTNVKNKKFNNLTEYYQFLCDKLNENGFKYPNIMSGELGPWEVKQYFMSSLTTNHAHQYQAFKFLKENGYFNLGICPNCGNQLNEIKYTYTSGFNSNINYPISLVSTKN